MKRSVLYIVVGVVFVLLTGVALISYHGKKETQQALAKATQLQAELTTSGMRVPPADRITRVLGDDGGAVCHDPRNGLRRSILWGMLTNGAAGPGVRPVIVDNKLLRGQLAIIKVYCPQYLEEFQEIVDDVRSAEV